MIMKSIPGCNRDPVLVTAAKNAGLLRVHMQSILFFSEQGYIIVDCKFIKAWQTQASHSHLLLAARRKKAPAPERFLRLRGVSSLNGKDDKPCL